MSKASDLYERLLRRFKGVPNFDISDATALVNDAIQTHGFQPSDDIPDEKTTLILLLAQSDGAWQVAISVAHYFRYTDGEESVDKSMVAEQYRKLARDLRDDYDAELAKDNIGRSAFKVMKRLDRV